MLAIERLGQPALASEQPALPTVSVILPAYNEELSIGREIETVQRAFEEAALSYELIVVDDGSTDRTAEIAAGYEGVRLIRHSTNLGSGAARKTGTLRARGEVVVWTDADCTYPNGDIPRLLAALEGADQVVGARRSEQGRYRLLRTPAKWFIRRLACYLAETEIPDLNSGLRAFRREVALPYLNLLPKGFSCVTTITLAFLCNGYSVKYVPIDYYPRLGRSKFHPLRDSYNYLLQVLRMITYFNPIKVFMPVALTMLAVGGAKTISDVIRYNFHVAPSTLLILLTATQLAAIGLIADLIVKRPR